MSIDLYYTPSSPPCQAVILTAHVLDVKLDLKLTDLQKGEHMTPEFLKMNPQHTVPTLNDHSFAISESRAILCYLADKYGRDDALYPKDLEKRTLVNQRLYFDIGTFWPRHLDYYVAPLFTGAAPDPEKLRKLEEAYGFLDQFLEGQQWVAGSNMTIADISLLASTAGPAAIGFSLGKFPHVAAWFEKTKKAVPSYDELTREGIATFKAIFDNATKK